MEIRRALSPYFGQFTLRKHTWKTPFTKWYQKDENKWKEKRETCHFYGDEKTSGDQLNKCVGVAFQLSNLNEQTRLFCSSIVVEHLPAANIRRSDDISSE